MTSKLEKLIAAVKEETGAGDVSAETRFDSMNIDSLDFVSLIRAVENIFDCVIPDSAYASLETIGDLAALIQ